MGSLAIQLIHGPLGPAESWTVCGAGAVIVFEGIVRPSEEGHALQALDYQSYEPMTSRLLEELGRVVIAEHGLLGMLVEHSIGRVPVGRISFRLCVASCHRAEGLAAMQTFIDRMKQHVPLWKVPVWQTDHEQCASHIASGLTHT